MGFFFAGQCYISYSSFHDGTCHNHCIEYQEGNSLNVQIGGTDTKVLFHGNPHAISYGFIKVQFM